jgi:pimeloyl-ACP methyl ester carboxylesterase
VYLSSRQALADLSHFIATTNDSYDLNHETKWVTFGGSYPGMMAAWARLEYPELVHAAVSNSAPIQMQVDFSAYVDRVSFDLQYPLVGGSQECLQIVLDGHYEIVDALAAGYHEKITSLFHVCDAQSLLIERNVDMWVGDGVIEIPAQGNDPTCEDLSCNIEKVGNYILYILLSVSCSIAIPTL